MTKRIFIEDYNRMNASYKLALYNTSKNEKEKSVGYYNELVASYAAFSQKYQSYRPHVLANDSGFEADLRKAGDIIKAVEPKLSAGDLKAAHYALEGFRPIFQEIFKRNGFSLLAITLVDFHDPMEKLF